MSAGRFAAASVADLLAQSSVCIDEDDLAALLTRAAELAESDGHHHALALLFRVLAEQPADLSAAWFDDVGTLARRCHPDSDCPALCRAVSQALAQWGDEDVSP